MGTTLTTRSAAALAAVADCNEKTATGNSKIQRSHAHRGKLSTGGRGGRAPVARGASNKQSSPSTASGIQHTPSILESTAHHRVYSTCRTSFSTSSTWSKTFSTYSSQSMGLQYSVALQMPEVIRCVLLCMSEAVEGGLLGTVSGFRNIHCGSFLVTRPPPSASRERFSTLAPGQCCCI